MGCYYEKGGGDPVISDLAVHDEFTTVFYCRGVPYFPGICLSVLQEDISSLMHSEN